MDNGQQQNQYGSQNQFGMSGAGSSPPSPEPAAGGGQGVPPPPSPDERVSVRTMASDMQSVKETGGQMPQSQIIDAPSIPSMSPEASMPSSPATPLVATSSGQDAPVVNPETNVLPPIAGGSIPDASKGAGSKTKIIFIAVGAVVIALALGWGAYYLVTSLTGSSSSVAPLATSSNNALPAAQTTSSVPVQQPTVIPPMTHVSLLLAPTQAETVTVSPGSDPGMLRAAVAARGVAGSLPVGGVRDLAMVDASSSPVQSPAVLAAYFPSFGLSLGGVVEPDFTSWFYLDKTGGSKLGFVFKLTPAAQTATTTIAQYIESNPADLANLFLATTTAPQPTIFKDGMVANIRVRFLAYNAKLGRVLEYGFLTGSDGSVYLILATSYNQMVDVVSRLKANPLILPSVLTPPTTTPTSSSAH